MSKKHNEPPKDTPDVFWLPLFDDVTHRNKFYKALKFLNVKKRQIRKLLVLLKFYKLFRRKEKRRKKKASKKSKSKPKKFTFNFVKIYPF